MRVTAWRLPSASSLDVFQLPENAMVDRITTHIVNSTLTVTVPKKDIKKHHGHSRSIKIISV